MNLFARIAVASALVAPVSASGGDIVRCVAPGGGVTYQERPCPEATREHLVPIATEYPPANLAERDRLLAREAEMYKRLEAQRDRDLREAILREARAEQEAAERARLAALATVQAEPQYIIAYPLRPGYGYGRMHPRPTRSPLLPHAL